MNKALHACIPLYNVAVFVTDDTQLQHNCSDSPSGMYWISTIDGDAMLIVTAT